MTSVIKVIYKGKTLVLTDLYNDYSIAKNKKQTYIPKICSIFNLTGLRHLLNPKIPTSRRNAVFFVKFS